MHETEHLAGPDFLDAFAEAQLAAGLEMNAAEFGRRARQWSDDNADRDAAWRAHNTLQLALANWKKRAAAALAQARQLPPSPAVFQLCVELAALADLPPPSCSQAVAPGARDPRVLPLPGDSFWLPVQVVDVGYGRGGFDVELFATADGAPLFDLAALPDRTADGSVQQWLRQAIGVREGDTPMAMHDDADAVPAQQAAA